MQYAQGIAYLTRHIFYSTGRGPSGTKDCYISWVRFILRETIIPQTIRISYDLLKRPGLRGVPASSSSQAGIVASAQGTATTALETYASPPPSPATSSCALLLACKQYTTNFNPEVAAVVSDGDSLDYFLRSYYQEQAVSTFLQNLGNQYQGPYNPSGRRIPDISAQAVDFRLFLGGTGYEPFGTSSSAPVTLFLTPSYYLARVPS
ncbi:hypothetical protein EDB86DRAFT_3076385 [Lactarius hatsudake]|nr:hypothetical protein EDB86DRAFT_3076385 [Lactarius hatsudake]